MQEYANCFSNTGTQIPKLPAHPEGDGMLGFLNPLLDEKLPETQRRVQEEILRQFPSPAVDFHFYLQTSWTHSPALLCNLLPVGERRSSIHLTAARLKQISLIVAHIGPSVLRFLNTAAYPWFFWVVFLFFFLMGSRGQIHVGGVRSPLWPGPWMRVQF